MRCFYDDVVSSTIAFYLEKDEIRFSIKGGNQNENHTENFAKLSRIQREIIIKLKSNPKYSRRELVDVIEKASLGGVISALTKLQELGLLRRIGPDKGGHWEIVEK